VAAVALAGATGTLSVPAQQARDSGNDLEVFELRPNFYMIAGAGANIAMQVGPMGAILVNSGSERMSDQVLAVVKRFSSKPIRYIINTSADADAVGGNAKLSKAGQSVLSGSVGNPGITADVIDNGGAASILANENVLTRMSGAAGGESLFPEPSWPTKTYGGKGYSMYLNGEGIQVMHQPAAHSDGDSIVFFRRNDVIVTGDIWDTTRFPVIDPKKGGSIQGEIAALNRLLDLTIPPVPLPWEEDRTLLISGHGRICDDSDLVEYRDTVTIIRDNIQDLINRGMTLPQIQKADPTKAYRARYGSDSGPWTTDMFVEAVYTGLTQRSLTQEKGK
jgi:glyoxylase-like metal-dependent hydrolase (beta-lactamase superfamily II)